MSAMSVSKRLDELRAKHEPSDFDRVERAGLYYLWTLGIEDECQSTTFEGKDKWAVWCADSCVWTARRMRAGEWREALRGFAQVREYRGRNGGFLPSGLSDCAIMLQNLLESKLQPR